MSTDRPPGPTEAMTADRRWLWRLHSLLMVTLPAGQHAINAELRAYLNATCTHDWHHEPAAGHLPAYRQCRWCHTVPADDAPEGGETP